MWPRRHRAPRPERCESAACCPALGLLGCHLCCNQQVHGNTGGKAARNRAIANRATARAKSCDCAVCESTLSAAAVSRGHGGHGGG